MNIDLKLESLKIAEEIISGTIDQACFEFENLLGNYSFLTSSNIDKPFLVNLGSHIAKHSRKSPNNFLKFCKTVWFDNIQDGRIPVGQILAVVETINPEETIPEIIEMCKDAKGPDDVDALVCGFEPVILKDPEKYLSLLNNLASEKNIWLERLVIITVGHIMYRYKTPEITENCLEIIRPLISKGDENTVKTSSWIIGSYGVRADQSAVAEFIRSFAGSRNASVVTAFSEAFRRSKISLQPDISRGLIPVFDEWSRCTDLKIKKSAENALRILRK